MPVRASAAERLVGMYNYPKKMARQHIESPKSIVEFQVEKAREFLAQVSNSGKNLRIIKKLGEDERFLAVIREAFKRRNKRGVTTFFKLGGDFNAMLGGLETFFKTKKMSFSQKGINTVLENPRLREELTEFMAEYVVSMSAKRYTLMNQRLIGELKKAGISKPVIIDYGAGQLTSTIYLQKMLIKAGIKPDIVATDKVVNPDAVRKKDKSQIAYVKHNLRTGPLLPKGQKADVIRLGYVLPYTLRENALRLARNAMKDVKTGGIICIGEPNENYRLYRKTGPNSIDLIHAGNEYIESTVPKK